jgi:hypothetical protein
MSCGWWKRLLVTGSAPERMAGEAYGTPEAEYRRLIG